MLYGPGPTHDLLDKLTVRVKTHGADATLMIFSWWRSQKILQEIRERKSLCVYVHMLVHYNKGLREKK